jgi:hypothetical protein
MIYDCVKVAPLRLVKSELRSAMHMGDVRHLIIAQTQKPGDASPTYFLFSCSLDATYKVWQLNLSDEIIGEEKDDATKAADSKLAEDAILAR